MLGDSHTVALGRGFALIEESRLERLFPGRITLAKLFSSPRVERRFSFVDESGVWFRDDEAQRVLIDVTGRDRIARRESTIFAFSIGFTTTKFIRLPVWATHVPWRVTERQGRQLISTNVFERLVLHYSRHVLHFYKNVARLRVECVAIEAPPPREDDRAIVDLGVPAEIVLAVDRTFREILVAALKRLGVSVVRVPPSVCLSREWPFLKPEFGQSGRSHHANEVYGKIMIEHVLKELSLFEGLGRARATGMAES